ncbi:hypothetical protein M5K25_013322 [Dendrobium thyrsiflorum]|uniref:Uncharacterized protein n=1 Tax=Dendrobium thyrsiflorum TaxID=117978 RepID=A0ABD0UZU4_DENTH
MPGLTTGNAASPSEISPMATTGCTTAAAFRLLLYSDCYAQSFASVSASVSSKFNPIFKELN